MRSCESGTAKNGVQQRLIREKPGIDQRGDITDSSKSVGDIQKHREPIIGLGPQAQVITFIHTRDRDASKAFYVDVLGFELKSEDGFAAIVDLNGISLRITHIPDHTAQPHTVLGWGVPNIEAAVQALNAKGVQMRIYEGMGQDALGIWTAPGGGVKVCFFDDPDGNNLSLTQF